MESFFIRALQLILSLSILVFAHELGHFFFSKLFKVRVEKFYLFFNPSFSIVRCKKFNKKWHVKFFAKNEKKLNTPITDSKGEHLTDSKGNYLYKVIDINDLPENDWRKHPESTEWGIGWLPLGGYCKIAGMIDESMDREQMKAAPKPWEYRAISAWKRLPIITGGVLVNFILALCIYSAILFTWGQKYVPVQNFSLGMDFSNVAKSSGFKDGDILLSADGVKLEKFDDATFRKIIEGKNVTVLRNDSVVSISIPKDLMKQLLLEKQGFASPRIPFVANKVIDQSPAFKAGFQIGDSLVAINAEKTATFFDFATKISNYKNKTVQVTVYRKDVLHVITVKPDSTGKIGIAPRMPEAIFKTKTISYSFAESLPAGIKLGISKLSGYVSDMKYIFTKEGVESLGGFGSIGKQFDYEWNWVQFWHTTAFLSVILAFMNILPIPGLDGGHLLFLLFEIITRRKPNEKFLEKAQAIGMIFLLFLILYVNINDLVNFIF